MSPLIISWPLIGVCAAVAFTIGFGGFFIGLQIGYDQYDTDQAATEIDALEQARPAPLTAQPYDPRDPWRVGPALPARPVAEVPPLYAWRPTVPLEAAPEPDTVVLGPRGWLAGILRATRPHADQDQAPAGNLETDLELAGYRATLEIDAMIEAAEATIGKLLHRDSNRER